MGEGKRKGYFYSGQGCRWSWAKTVWISIWKFATPAPAKCPQDVLSSSLCSLPPLLLPASGQWVLLVPASDPRKVEAQGDRVSSLSTPSL